MLLPIIAAFVETPYYVAAAALVIFVAVFWFALKHKRSLLLRFNRARHCGVPGEFLIKQQPACEKDHYNAVSS